MSAYARKGLRALGLPGLPNLGRLCILALLVVLGAVGAGCANGTYPLDLFYEMHYQQSYASHEPPRLWAPEGAVPITGRGDPPGGEPHSGAEG